MLSKIVFGRRVVSGKFRYSIGSSASANQLEFLLALFFLLLDNGAFWRELFVAIEPASFHDFLFVGSIGVVLGALILIVCTLITIPYIFKPLAITLLLCAAGSAYFMATYGVVIDAVMIENVVETNVTEAADLISGKLILYLVVLGVVPSVIIFRVSVVYQNCWRAVLKKIIVILVSLCIAVALILSFSAGYASFFRNHKNVRLMANPLNLIYAGARYLAPDNAPKEMTKIGMDARLGDLALKQAKPTLLLLVIGETARAANFGLDGYVRNTTPLLDRRGVINFPNFYSCGTSTSVSLPCMFSDLDRANYHAQDARHREGLLDVINRAGVSVFWRDNNSGCKGVCDRVNNENVFNSKIPSLCKEGECYDEILLRDLDAKLASDGSSQIIVLHQMGSHGPEYYRRYPPQAEYYSPVCTSNQLQDCSLEEVVNAYDNSIRYTDQFLDASIAWLKQQEAAYDTVLLYVSDHGESLGENHLYLHGMPYSIAPIEQKHVPFLAWFSAGFINENKLDVSCIRAESSGEFSHDNLFHSVLGLLDIQTQVMQSKMDIFGKCQKSFT